MAKKTKSIPRYYKETPEARAERVREEAGRYRSKIVQSKTQYNRQQAKRPMYD